MDNVLLGLAVLMITIFDYCLMKRRDLYGTKGVQLLRALKPGGVMEMLSISGICFSVAAVAVMMKLFYEADFIFNVKRLVLLGILWPIAVTDYQQYRIPNKMLLMGLGCRALLYIPELILSGSSMKAVVMLELIAAIGAIVIALICVVLSKGGMGMGDLKLMVVMALFLGIEGICYAMFFALLISFVASVFLLISKRKSRTDAIPFAPFILAGTLASFILSGM